MSKEVKFCPLCNKEYTPPTCQPCTDEFCKPISIKTKMNKEFIPYEEALALKELGFDEECLDLYWYNTKHWRKGTLVSSNIAEHTKDDCITAPLYQQAFRWFREKGIEVPMYQRGPKGYSIDGPYNTIIESYEEAELACLRKLIEILNQNKDE